MSLQFLSHCPPPLLRGALVGYKSRVAVRRCRSLSFDLVFRNGDTRQHIPIHTHCPQRASACRSVLSVLRNSLTYAPAKANVNVGLGPERTRPDRCQRQDTAAAANLVVPIASMGHTGSALPPRSSPRQTTLAAEVLLPLLPPVYTLPPIVFSRFLRVDLVCHS